RQRKLYPKMYREGKTANVVVVDPPRKGCDEKGIRDYCFNESGKNCLCFL
ncbi:hypothetical protein BER30_003659, partial [Clostridioides difficile]